jgi:tetratricopeptide (TPR) repeat protein
VYERILAIDPRAVVAANNLAYMHAEAGTNLDVALGLAQTAKAGRPNDPDVSDTLGWIYYKRNLANLAIPPLEESLRANPSNALYQYHLGLAYLKEGRKDSAREALEKALKLQPNFDGASEARKALTSLQG